MIQKFYNLEIKTSGQSLYNFTKQTEDWIKKNCEKNDLGCRRRQRQAILQWAYNPFI